MEIKPYEKNAKKHPTKQVVQVAESIKRFGMNQPIVVDKDGVIIVGHGRYLALQHLGWEVKPEYVKQLDTLTPEEVNAYRLADNKLNESEWDMTLVLEDLKGLDDDLVELTGFDKDLLIEADEADDEVPDVPEEPQSKLGDLYELGNHRVLCGDSTKIEDVERLMDGKKADLIHTDPPYGVSYDGGHAEKGKRREKLENDGDADIYGNSLPLAVQFSKDGSAFYVWYSDSKSLAVLSAVLSAGLEVRNHIIWNKNMAQFGAIGAQYKSKHEPCLYMFKKGKSPQWFGPTNEISVWDIKRASKNEFHPTQKPIELVERVIKNSSKQDDIVLDLFLGSGSTLIASEKTGRICYGMELDPKYIDVIVQRYVDYTGNDTIVKNGESITWKKTEQKPN